MRTVAAAASVTVNGVVIAAADIARELQYQKGESPRAAWEAATKALIVRELMAQRARELGIVAEPRAAEGARETDEEALIRGLIEVEIRTPTADEAACRRYYQANLPRFRTPDLFEPAHILFTASSRDEAAYGRAVARAEAVLAELREHPDRFDRLARSLSDCASAGAGGRLGQVSRGETTPEFEAALVSLEPGEICAAPVHARYGVHVLRLERKVAGRVLAFELVRDRIASYLEESVWRRAVAQYVSLLVGRARIDGIDLSGAVSPLVR